MTSMQTIDYTCPRCSTQAVQLHGRVYVPHQGDCSLYNWIRQNVPGLAVHIGRADDDGFTAWDGT